MSDEPTDPEPALEEIQHFTAAANQMRRPPYTDREMWIAIRAGLIGIVEAIDTFGKGNLLAQAVRRALLKIISAIELHWDIKRHRSN